MAFKMKGSPIKLGGIATKSVLKQKSPAKDKYPDDFRSKEVVEKHNKDYAENPNHDKDMHPGDSGVKMKSPMKDLEYNTSFKHPHVKPKETDRTSVDHHGNVTYKKRGPKMKSPTKQKYERVNPTESNPEGRDVKVTTKKGKTKTYSRSKEGGITKTTSRKVGALEGLLTKKKKGETVTKSKEISENKAMNQLERAKKRADKAKKDKIKQSKKQIKDFDKKSKDPNYTWGEKKLN